MYPQTAILSVAREAGAAVANGLGMLLHQGARAFTIWTNEEPDVDVMRRALEEAVYGSGE
jgi:shikimate dehydrogenase